ncbi:hypothetical protein PIB30_064238, partial [Stylosanthes scabra]|nr:hypothetical protein [Stylosanthes scabra]
MVVVSHYIAVVALDPGAAAVKAGLRRFWWCRCLPHLLLLRPFLPWSLFGCPKLIEKGLSELLPHLT